MLSVMDPSPLDTALAEATRLQDENRYRDAAELLAEAAASNGAGTVLLERLAWVEKMQDHDGLALALLEAAREGAPADAGLVAEHVRVLTKLRRFHRALAVLDEPAAREPVVRDAAAELYRTMGLPALAVDAQADRPRWRKARHGLWWATGGPLGFLRRRQLRRDRDVLRDWPADPSPAPEPDGDAGLLARVRAVAATDRRVDAVLDRAQKLIDEDEFPAAAEVLADGLALDPGVAVLARLAFVEELRGHDEAASARFAQARRRDPGNLDLVRDEAQFLTRLRRFRAALALLADLPEVDRRDPRIRVARADVYRTMGLPALARQAYGDPRSLDRYERRERRRDWWRAGGPLRLLLWKPLRFERRVVDSWRSSTRYLRVFDTLTWPAGFDPTEVRCRLDAHLQRSALMIERLWSIRWWLRRAVDAVTVVLAWYALLRLAGGVAPWRAAAVAAIGTGAAFALYRFVFFRLIVSRNWYDFVLRDAPAGLVLIGAGYALTRLGDPGRDWWLVAGGVLIAAAGMALGFLIAMAPTVAWALLAFRRHWGRSPREDILDELGEILDDLAEPGRRNDLEWRAWWAVRLERAAVATEKRLPASLALSDDTTRRWAAELARGAAAALRRMKRYLAAPVDGSWDRLASELRHEIVALTTGDLGKLRWTAPPSRTAARRSWWRTALSLFTTVGLAVAPLVAVFAVQPLLHLDGGTLRWAKVIGLGWAVLYLLIAADPTLREKIETAQSVSNLLGTSRRPRSSDGEGTP
jgi:tetratricopeptide (TPR) repeat protein